MKLTITEKAIVYYLKSIHPSWGFGNVPRLLAEAIELGEHLKYCARKKKGPVKS